MGNNAVVTDAIMRRMPRYRRHLGILQNKGIKKVSSNELSELIGYSASQIRQDLNAFGKFGHQGFGYDVARLYKEVNKILGLDREHKTVIVGAGNMGQAITNYTYYYKIGFNIIGVFDKDVQKIGTKINDVEIMDIETLPEFCKEKGVDIGIICVTSDNAQKVAEKLVEGEVKGIWNFAPVDLQIPKEIALESVHLSDSLHALSFMIMNRDEEIVK